MAIDPLACHSELDVFTCAAGEVLEGYDFAGTADCLVLLACFLNVRIENNSLRGSGSRRASGAPFTCERNVD
jgi:hypothetical protein